MAATDLRLRAPDRLADDAGGLPHPRTAPGTRGIVAWSASPERGLTAGLWVESQGRRDVLDLGRVVETEPGGSATLAWSLLTPNRTHSNWRLLLHVEMARPVQCTFTIGFNVGGHPSDELRRGLPLLLAADLLALAFDGSPQPGRPLPLVSAPNARDSVLQVFLDVGAP